MTKILIIAYIFSLKRNPIQVLDATIFVPLRQSRVHYLNLQSCRLEFIHRGITMVEHLQQLLSIHLCSKVPFVSC